MTVAEEAVEFECHGEQLIGILSRPAVARTRGVLIIVGGPQYRVGSHRQFVSLARSLAAFGYPVFRFDYRGMGDSFGEQRSFASIDDDIAAAIDAMLAACDSVQEVAIWGLCDGASAGAIYVSRDDPRVCGLALVNPWVRDSASFARTQIKHYYAARLVSRELWSKLLAGGLSLRRVARELFETVASSLAASQGDDDVTKVRFQARMVRGLQAFRGPALLVLSGNDLTAREFVEYTSTAPEWRRVLERPTVSTRELADADHTFSRRDWQRRMERIMEEWLAAW